MYCYLRMQKSIGFQFAQEIVQVLLSFNLIKAQQDHNYIAMDAEKERKKKMDVLLTNLQNIFHTVRFQQFESLAKTQILRFTGIR